MGDRQDADPLHNILETISDPVCALDSNLRVTRWNEAAVDRFNYPSCEATGESIADLFSLTATEADRLESLIETISRAGRAEKTEQTARITATKASGARIELELIPVASDGERIYCLLETVSRIGRSRVEVGTDELSVFRKAVEESTDMIAALDRQKRVIFANRRYREFHGIDSPVEGAHLSDLLPAETYATIDSRIERVFSTGEPLDFEMERQGPDGSLHEFYVEYYPIDTRDGEVVGGVATIRDVTELKQQTHALREAWETYRELVAAIPDPIVLYEPDGGIIEVNQATKHLLGYSTSELLDSSFDDLLLEGRTEWIESRLRDGDPESVVFETQFVTRDGTTVPIEVAVTRIDYFTTEATLVIARDRSEHKQYQRHLETANARLEEFATIVTQDLRNPLTVAKGWTRMVRETHSFENLEKIETSLDRMDEIIEYTLTLAHEGDGIGHLSSVDLNDVIRESWLAVDPQLATLESNIDLTVRGDYGRLSYLFRTLFQRSADLGEPELTVTVDALPVGSGFFVAFDGPELQLDDRGLGVTSSHLGRSEAEDFDLMAVRRIADAHGWKLRLGESEAGGAKFEFRGVETNSKQERGP
ncbi:MAG: PAS domain S-box protein [Halodesulfurarchaeum sp.]|nr:PAS domain S-box protein [Halodesulfurarchaeum sp.]